MKKFTLIVLAAFVAVSTFAQANVSKEQRRALGKQNPATHALKSQVRQQAERLALPFADNRLTVAKAPKKSADYTISETPEGTLYKLLSSYTLDSYWSGISDGQALLEVVEAADGTLWINGLTPGAYGTLFWVKAEPTDNEGEYIVNQQLAAYYASWDEYDEVARLDYDEEADDYVPAEEPSFKVYFKDGQLSVEEDVIYGLVYDDEGEFAYEGDAWPRFSSEPFTLTVTELPEGAVAEDYALKHIEGAKGVQVAFVDDKVYVKSSDAVDGWYVGTVEGDKVTFENDQYLGYSDQYNVFFYLITGSYVEQDGGYYGEITDNAVFTLDADAKTLTPVDDNTALYINAAEDRVYYLERYLLPSFEPFVEVAAVPADPTIRNWWDYEDYYESSELDFTINLLDVNGNLLNAAKTSYQVYLDDEVFVFSTDEYGVEDDIDEIPYGYTDGYGIGTSYVLFFFQPGENVGLQTIYRGGDEENVSNIVLYNINTGETDIVFTGISQANTQTLTVAAEAYHDASGRQVTSSTKGFVIKTVTFADGSKKSYKVVR